MALKKELWNESWINALQLKAVIRDGKKGGKRGKGEMAHATRQLRSSMRNSNISCNLPNEFDLQVLVVG